MDTIIRKTDLLKSPEKYGLILGKNPAGRIIAYERFGLFPSTVTLGGKYKGRAGFYSPAHIDLLKCIVDWSVDHRYSGIRKKAEKEFRTLLEMTDLIELFRMRFLDENMVQEFLNRSSLNKTQQKKILKLFSDQASHKEVKIVILDMMCKLKSKTI